MKNKIVYTMLLVFSVMVAMPQGVWAEKEEFHSANRVANVSILSDQDAIGLLNQVAVGNAPIQVAVLQDDEMKETQGASRFSRWWRRQSEATQQAVIRVTVAVTCVATGALCPITW